MRSGGRRRITGITRITRIELLRTLGAVSIATLLIASGMIHLPATRAPLRHPPVVVYSDPMVQPLIVRARKALPLMAMRGPFDRAPVGQAIRVSLTQYCLQGLTRRDNYVRHGIVAADPRVFPLARYVEVFVGKEYLGRFLVDDTGKNVKGATLDIWTPSCADARRFGRRWGSATLVAR